MWYSHTFIRESSPAEAKSGYLDDVESVQVTTGAQATQFTSEETLNLDITMAQG